MSDIVDALKSYRQADQDGVMVTVSRQACDEAAAELTRLRARVEELEADKRDLLKHADVQRMPARLLSEALAIAEAAFSNRGDRGGSPGEWAWERMNEIETRISRAARAPRKD